MNRRTRTATTLGAALLALVAASCSSVGAGPAELPDTLPSEVPAGTSLVVADQSESVQSALAVSGEGEDLAADVSYANFVGGPAILEAFRAGAADLAMVGDTPPIQALAAGEDVRIVAAVRRDPDAWRLAVAPGSDARSLADLAGTRIAYAEGTSQQTTVLRALKKAGLGVDDVELVPLQLADFPDAVRTDQVDIAVLLEPNLTRFLDGTPGAAVIDPEETEGLGTGLQYLYARGEVLQDPAQSAAVRDVVTHWVAAHRWIDENPQVWASEYYVDGQGLTPEDGTRIVESSGPATFPALDQDLVDQQQASVDVLAEFDQLPVEDLRAADGFDLRFADAVADAAGQEKP